MKFDRLFINPDFYASIFLFFSGLAFYFIIVPKEIIVGDEAVIGPDYLPKLCIFLITLLAALLFIKTVRSSNKVDIKEDSKTINKSEKDEFSLTNINSADEFTLIEVKRVSLLSVTILISILLFINLDVFISVIFLLIGSCLVCGLRKLWVIGVLSFCLIFLSYLLLYKVLGTAVG